MHSLKGRLSLGLAASLVLLLGLQWWVASRAIEGLTTEQLLSRLAHDAETLLAGARFDASGAFAIDPARVNAIYQRPFSGHYYVVIAGAQKRLRQLIFAIGRPPSERPQKRLINFIR